MADCCEPPEFFLSLSPERLHVLPNRELCVNGLFYSPSLTAPQSAMETSSPPAAQKKDKMDGSSFSDLPKKPSPSETRGNAPFQSRVRLSVSREAAENEPGSHRCSARGQRGAMKYTFQRRSVVPGAGALCGLMRNPQQSEVTRCGCLTGILIDCDP